MMVIKNRDKLVPWEDVRKEVFTLQQMKINDAQARIRIALRKVRERREKEKLTQELLAQKANVPRTTISKIESGYQNVTIKKLMQIAEAMDMRVEIDLIPIEK